MSARLTTELFGPRKRFAAVEVDTSVGKASAVWVEAAVEGAHYGWDPSTPRVLWTRDHFAEIVSNLGVMNGLGYATPVLRNHMHDGLTYGQIHDARVSERVDGKAVLELLTSFRSKEERDAYNDGKITHFSPGVDWEALHPETGERLGVLVYEFSFVSEPAQKTLRPPQETNPGVTLSTQRQTEGSPMSTPTNDTTAEQIEAIRAELAAEREKSQRLADEITRQKLSAFDMEDTEREELVELARTAPGIFAAHIKRLTKLSTASAASSSPAEPPAPVEPPRASFSATRSVQEPIGTGAAGNSVSDVATIVQLAAAEGIDHRENPARFVYFVRERVKDHAAGTQIIKAARTYAAN